jgi:hypothetical protein
MFEELSSRKDSSNISMEESSRENDMLPTSLPATPPKGELISVSESKHEKRE